MPTDAAHLTFNQLETMRAGARVAARTCMGISPADRVFILTDRTTHGIGRLLSEEASDAGGEVLLHDLEQYTERPVKALPEHLRADLLKFRPTVTFYAASTQPGEVTFRNGLRVFLLNDLSVRHAHMPGVSAQLMQEGMRTDYRSVAAVTTAVYDMARMADAIRVTTADGTDLTAVFDPALRWVPCTGLYHRPGQWGNLPEGETYSCPQRVDGVLVAHVIGDYFSERFGVLKEPVQIQIANGAATAVRSANAALASELEAYLDSAENARRVGEFAIGTNISLKKLSGNMLQDEKIPGVHVAFGNPHPAETGALWASQLHIDMIPHRCTISIDGETIMKDGRFDYELLGVPPPRG
jgi:leucyl aminopeptidase (aminopeptidase T)